MTLDLINNLNFIFDFNHWVKKYKISFSPALFKSYEEGDISIQEYKVKDSSNTIYSY